MSCQVVGNRSREHRPPRRGARSGERQLLLEETNIGELAGQFACFKILLRLCTKNLVDTRTSKSLRSSTIDQIIFQNISCKSQKINLHVGHC